MALIPTFGIQDDAFLTAFPATVVAIKLRPTMPLGNADSQGEVPGEEA